MSRYIDAEELNKLLCEAKNSIPVFNGGICKAKMIVREMPTADVEEVRHGKWIPQPSMDDMYSSHYICSVCGRVGHVLHSDDIKTFLPYCHCGAKMDK